jgi:dienelactone hydrolase
LSIYLKGVTPSERVTVRSSIAGGVWEADASFEADASGTIDLGIHAPISGSYSGVDSMGLIWSATLKASQESVLDALRDVEPITITFDAVVNGNVICTETVVRQQLAEGVRREIVRDNGLFGTLFVPNGGGPHPAVTVVSGSGGGLSESLASLFAAHGVAGFALAYFNYESLPKSLTSIPLEYFETGIEFLQAHHSIDGERLAIAGASRGGELSLLLGSVYPQFKTVIAWVPSGLVWGGFGGAPQDGTQPAWLLNGKAVPFMDGDPDPSDYSYMVGYQARGKGIPGTPGFVTQIEKDAERVRKATIPVERIQGAVLMISGKDDQMWPSTRLAEVSVQRLRDHDFAYPYEHISYPGAGHLFGMPYFPTTMVESKHPVDGVLYAFGGDAESNMRASVDSWRRVRNFLSENL